MSLAVIIFGTFFNPLTAVFRTKGGGGDDEKSSCRGGVEGTESPGEGERDADMIDRKRKL